eukprot:CAMPEP_0171810774 /NCGR_PEP_ID=MMETSP0991-20121206/77748_1 /TAXON_ID=483369 /ORGANISM="non described non described, Strain CCMP2098" /LENGTH=193 /DNA_ID=CAMNT_0012424085 /DNA_START=40 /DNA_END=622 /DNA_ORIENTATION=+
MEVCWLQLKRSGWASNAAWSKLRKLAKLTTLSTGSRSIITGKIPNRFDNASGFSCQARFNSACRPLLLRLAGWSQVPVQVGALLPLDPVGGGPERVQGEVAVDEVSARVVAGALRVVFRVGLQQRHGGPAAAVRDRVDAMKRRMHTGGRMSTTLSSTRSMEDPAVLGTCTKRSVALPAFGAPPSMASGTTLDQ